MRRGWGPESCPKGSQEIRAHPWGQLIAKDIGRPGDLTAGVSGVRGAFGLILRAAGCGIGRGLRASFYPQDCSRTWGQTDPASGGIRTFCGRNRRQQFQRQEASADQPDRRTEELSLMKPPSPGPKHTSTHSPRF